MEDAERTVSEQAFVAHQVEIDQAKTTVASGYLPVDLALLRTGPRREFDLYQRVGRNMVLICSKHYALTGRALTTIKDDRQATLFVPVSQGPQLSWHVESILREVALDEKLTVARRSRILVGSANAILSEAMANPTAKGLVRRGVHLANATVNFMVQDPASLRSMATLFTKDYCTYTHCVRTCVLGVALHKYILSPKVESLRRFGLGLLLHDTGKTMVDHFILNKPGRLEENEFELVKSHPRLGWQILQQQGVKDAMVREAVLHHHEKLDGTGYPDGVSGFSLSAEARIAAIVDVYDALTSERPYRTGMGHEHAMELMKANMVGTHLDPEYLTAFEKMGKRLPPRLEFGEDTSIGDGD